MAAARALRTVKRGRNMSTCLRAGGRWSKQRSPPCISGGNPRYYRLDAKCAAGFDEAVLRRADGGPSVLSVGFHLHRLFHPLLDTLLDAAPAVDIGRFRGTLFQLERVSFGVADFHARCLERVVEEPALGVGEAAGRQGLVDLLHGQEAAPDSPGEERLPGLVRAPDFQRGHAAVPPYTPIPKLYPFSTPAAGFGRRLARFPTRRMVLRLRARLSAGDLSRGSGRRNHFATPIVLGGRGPALLGNRRSGLEQDPP